MGNGATAQLYRGYEAEDELSMNGCIFRAAQHLGLVAVDETGFGWNKAEICELSDQIRARVADDPTVLNDLTKDIRVRLADGLNLFPRLEQPITRVGRQGGLRAIPERVMDRRQDPT